MYSLSITRDFIARHFLVGGDWGPENQVHSHHYRMEVLLEGTALDRHGYLVDIVDLERHLGDLVAHYRDCTLNELPEFRGLNPSIEHFCRILAEALSARLQAPNITALTARLWENEIAWAAYRMIRDP